MKNTFITSLISIITFFSLLFIFQPINISLADESDVNYINSPLESLKTIENNIINVELLTPFKYKQTFRRNIFKDIKSSKEMQESAEISIKYAQRAIYKKKIINKGIYSLKLLNESEKTLNLALEAFNNHNFFRAQSLADKSFEYCMDAGPFFGYTYPIPNPRIYYIDQQKIHSKNIATLYIINDDTGTGRKINICKGETFEEKLTKHFTYVLNSEKTEIINNSIIIQSFYVEEITPDIITISKNTNEAYFNKTTYTINKKTMEYLLCSEF